MNPELLTALLAWLSGGCLLAGGLLILIAGIGLLRLPDIYCRGHALGVGLCLGLSLMLLGLWLDLGLERAGIKIPLAILLQCASVPVASHLLALVARRRQLERRR